MHGTRILDEADRLMTVCNSCRYCEGLCAVFPAMELRRSFGDGEVYGEDPEAGEPRGGRRLDPLPQRDRAAPVLS